MKILTNSEIKVISGGDKKCVTAITDYTTEMECQNLEILIKEKSGDEKKIGSFAENQYSADRAETIFTQLKTHISTIKSEFKNGEKVIVRRIPA